MDIDDLPEALMYLYPTVEVNSSNDAFVLLLHAFMLEIGFIPKDISESEKLKQLPENWHEKETYKIVYYHTTCPELCCSMTCFPLYQQLSIFGTVINAHVPREPPNLCLHTNYYINSNNIESLDPSKVYCRVRQLAQGFKDKYAFPLLAIMQYAAGFGPTFGLAAVMDDVKVQILSYLPVGGLVAMSLVNKEFNELCNSTSLWKKLCLKDFPDVSGDCEEAGQDWKKMYKERYLKQKEEKQKQQNYLHFRFKQCGCFSTANYLYPPLPIQPEFGPDFLIGIQERVPFPELQPQITSNRIMMPRPPFPHNPTLNIPDIFKL